MHMSICLCFIFDTLNGSHTHLLWLCLQLDSSFHYSLTFFPICFFFLITTVFLLQMAFFGCNAYYFWHLCIRLSSPLCITPLLPALSHHMDGIMVFFLSAPLVNFSSAFLWHIVATFSLLHVVVIVVLLVCVLVFSCVRLCCKLLALLVYTFGLMALILCYNKHTGMPTYVCLWFVRARVCVCL